MQIAVFVLSAAVSLLASTLLVVRLERVGARLGLSEALLGLLAALAADGPEITSAAAAVAGGHGTLGIGVALGSNVFNLAALLGISAVVAGRVAFHRRALILEGTLGLLMALLSVAVVAGLILPWPALLIAMLVFIPYLGFSALGPTARARLRLPGRSSQWLARAIAEEEAELVVALEPRRGDLRDGGVALVALVVVVAASLAMEETAASLGAQAGLPSIVVGGLILAAVTSLPNAVAAVYLASRGRGAATLSEAFNSNAINVVAGFLVPNAIVGLAASAADAMFVPVSYLLLTAVAVVLGLRGRGLDRRAGAAIILGYVAFAVILATK